MGCTSARGAPSCCPGWRPEGSALAARISHCTIAAAARAMSRWANPIGTTRYGLTSSREAPGNRVPAAGLWRDDGTCHWPALHTVEAGPFSTTKAPPAPALPTRATRVCSQRQQARATAQATERGSSHRQRELPTSSGPSTLATAPAPRRWLPACLALQSAPRSRPPAPTRPAMPC